MRRLILACLGLLLPTATVHAWGTKEHLQLTRFAAMQLLADDSTPPEMKAWLKEAAPGLMDMDGERDYFMNKRMGIIPRGADGLMFWSVMPDMATLMDKYNKKLKPLNIPEGPMHFFEIEFYGPNPPPLSSDGKPKGTGKELLGDAAPASSSYTPPEYSRIAIKPDLSKKPPLKAIKRDPTDKRLADGGALPYRAAECYDAMVKAISAGKLNDKPGQYPRDEHATKWAGYLAHYVQDSTQPQHSTWDYKSRAFFPEKTRNPDVHSLIEWKMADEEFDDYPELRAAYWPILVEAIKDAKELSKSSDAWQSSVEASYLSYDALPLIGEAAIAAWDKDAKPEGENSREQGRIDIVKFYNHRGQAFGREMSVLELKARQQAFAVGRTKAAWLNAWKEAKAPAPVEHIGP